MVTIGNRSDRYIPTVVIENAVQIKLTHLPISVFISIFCFVWDALTVVAFFLKNSIFITLKKMCTLPPSQQKIYFVLQLCNATVQHCGPQASCSTVSVIATAASTPPAFRILWFTTHNLHKPQVLGKINSSVHGWVILSSCPVQPPSLEKN